MRFGRGAQRIELVLQRAHEIRRPHAKRWNCGWCGMHPNDRRDWCAKLRGLTRTLLIGKGRPMEDNFLQIAFKKKSDL